MHVIKPHWPFHHDKLLAASQMAHSEHAELVLGAQTACQDSGLQTSAQSLTGLQTLAQFLPIAQQPFRTPDQCGSLAWASGGEGLADD